MNRRKLVMYTRAGCGLCEDMQEAVAASIAGTGATLTLIDISNDPQLHAAHGERIPVLLVDGEELCFGRLDEDLLEQALDSRA